MKNLFITDRFFAIIIGLCLLLLISHFLPLLFFPVQIALLLFFALVFVEIFSLFRLKNGIEGSRITSERLSNGDENPIKIPLKNRYNFPVYLRVIDEVPIQFQVRDKDFKDRLAKGESKTIHYTLRPTERGVYDFGNVNAFASTFLGLVQRRFRIGEKVKVPVYPSFLQMRKFELQAITNHLSDYGIKKLRKIGTSMEFEQIKKYVQGDDYRVINWKATARRNDLMINQFQDEKSQNIYNVIDMGRIMKMPFNNLTLLDHAINSSLVLSNIALKKDDKAGLVTFNNKLGTIVKADRAGKQMSLIQEALYGVTTGFSESDYYKLYALFKTKLSARSLIILYTNYETISGLKRTLPVLRKLSRQHVLVVVFFENTELEKFSKKKSEDLTEVYDKIIAEKLSFEKRQIVKELNKYGIQSILTTSEKLTVNTINKYLEIKARGLI